MDPVTVLSVTASVIAFIDFGSKVVKRLDELAHAGDVPKVFRDVRTRLPIILQIVERVRDTSREFSPHVRSSVDDIIRSCHEQVEKLEKILESIAVLPSDSRWRRGATAVYSLIQEEPVERIANALKDNVDLLVSLHVGSADAAPPEERRNSSRTLPPAYEKLKPQSTVPFERDLNFIGRVAELDAVSSAFSQLSKVGIVGIGGVGKSQIAVEYCYRYREQQPESHVFWVFGGNAVRFKEDYKRIAHAVRLPGRDEPDVDVIQLVADWLSQTDSAYLLVLDNADNMKDWWPSKYASMVPDDSEPADNLANYLPTRSEKGRLLVTTRDSRISSRLSGQKKPIPIQPMSKHDARELFLCRVGDNEYPKSEVDGLVEGLDLLPLAISQAAAFLEQHEYYTITEYLEALQTDEGEEFLQEELDDARRHQDSLNSIFRTWKISFDQICAQKPKAADLLVMMSMFDFHSIPKSLLAGTDEFKTELTTALGTLQSFHLIVLRSDKASFQMHRLVHRFVGSHARRSQIVERWRAAALKCVTAAYPVEIGPSEYDTCEGLAPHVVALIPHVYSTDKANLDLATLLCWSADFAIEKSEYVLATARAKRSLSIFEKLTGATDNRLASAKWIYGRLLYFQAVSDEDMDAAASMLQNSFRIAEYKTLVYAESAFELAHLAFDQGKKDKCLEMAKASYECWRDIEGPDSQRALDNLHDYALWLGLFGNEAEGIAKWHEILKLCRTSHDSSEETRKVYELRSFASIAEFGGDASLAEDFYQKLIALCDVIYNDNQGHVFDYRLAHCEQILRQERSKEALELAQEILHKSQRLSEWQIHVTCIDIMAECYRLQGDLMGEEAQRREALKMHEKNLTRTRAETIPSLEALAHCLMRSQQFESATPLWEEVVSWRVKRLGADSADTVRASISRAVCLAQAQVYPQAEEAFVTASKVKDSLAPLALRNLCVLLAQQRRWDDMERHCQTLLQWGDDGELKSMDSALSLEQVNELMLFATERRGKADGTLAHLDNLSLDDRDGNAVLREGYVLPPLPLPRRFNRILQTRTWSG